MNNRKWGLTLIIIGAIGIFVPVMPGIVLIMLGIKIGGMKNK